MKYFYINPDLIIPIYQHFKILNIELNLFNEPHSMYKVKYQQFKRERNRKTKVKYFEMLEKYSYWNKSKYKINSDILKSFILWMGIKNPNVQILYTEMELDQKEHSVKKLIHDLVDIKYEVFKGMNGYNYNDLQKEVNFISAVQDLYIEKLKKIEEIVIKDGNKRI